MGLVFGICVQKNCEITDQPPVYKYRYVFQGNRVRDQNWENAMFQDLGSSPASTEASRSADFYGCLPGHDVEQADAEQAYVQSLLKGPETWVQIPVEWWPPEWFNSDGSHKYRCPVVLLLRALYGHPDSGTFWEEHCNGHCLECGLSQFQIGRRVSSTPILACFWLSTWMTSRSRGPRECFQRCGNCYAKV